jgi:uncharacterized protein (DUF433 family)
MQLEDYFEFEKCNTPLGEVDRIRFKGCRIAIEHILDSYLQGESAECIFYNYRHTLTLEQIYAAITFYYNRKVEMDAYLERGRKLEDALYQAYLKKEPDELIKRLRSLAAERAASRTGDG